MDITIRGWRTQVTEERVSEGITADVPLRKVVAAAVANRGRLNSRLGGLKAADVVGGDGLR